VDAVPGDNDEGGSGELLDDVCIGCRSEKFRFNRGFKQAELPAKRLAKRLGVPHQGILLLRKRPRPDKQLLTSNAR
jgi:predicted amidophosphoribosyltransferase